MKAIILAAGEGTRLRPLTLTTPKPLLEVGGKPMLERALDKILQTGITDIAVNVHHLGDQIIDFLASRYWNARVRVSDERETLLDTGGGILQASRLLGAEEDILIYNSDVVTDLDLKELIKAHLQFRADATMLVQDRESSRKLEFDEHMSLVKRSPQGKAFNGIHIISPRGLRKLREYGKTHPGAFPIVPFYLEENVEVKGWEYPGEYKWVDAGKPESLKKANECFNK